MNDLKANSVTEDYLPAKLEGVADYIHRLQHEAVWHEECT
jgi:hypothetical protein